MPAKKANTKPVEKKVRGANKAKKVVKQTKANIRTTPIFRRPFTKRTPKSSKVPTTTKLQTNEFNHFKLLKYPLGTEHVLKKIEGDNTLAFIVERNSTKPNIKSAVEKLYSVKVAKVNTLIRPDGEKKAYVKLAKGSDALETANKIGLV